MSRREMRIRKAMKLLEDKTPLWTDCGALCGKRCCQGGESDGMLLLPGEDKILEDTPFRIIRFENDAYCICDGTCDRAARPFSCRIFPFFPVPVEWRSGRYAIRVVPDIRAFSMCPLLRREDVRFDRRFLHAVKRAGRELMKDPELRQWLLDITYEMRDTAHLHRILIEE